MLDRPALPADSSPVISALPGVSKLGPATELELDADGEDGEDDDALSGSCAAERAVYVPLLLRERFRGRPCRRLILSNFRKKILPVCIVLREMAESFFRF